MLLTITNTSAVTALNAPTVGGSGVSADAVGGTKTLPLPYPFNLMGTLAASGTKQLPMRSADWHYKAVPSLTFEPATEWNMMIQAGQVTIAIAAEAISRDAEDRFMALV